VTGAAFGGDALPMMLTEPVAPGALGLLKATLPICNLPAEIVVPPE